MSPCRSVDGMGETNRNGTAAVNARASVPLVPLVGAGKGDSNAIAAEIASPHRTALLTMNFHIACLPVSEQHPLLCFR